VTDSPLKRSNFCSLTDIIAEIIVPTLKALFKIKITMRFFLGVPQAIIPWGYFNP
jgi:hypothetical protein